MSTIIKVCAVWLTFVSGGVNASEVLSGKPTLEIPYQLIEYTGTTTTDTSKININDQSITITAKKGTDLYTSPDGSNTADNAPRVYFEPKSDFIFSTKVNSRFNSAYDGGAIFVYADTDNWGKLLFERFKSGENGIASTVAHGTGDDAYHSVHIGTERHLKIVRRDKTFIFYQSEDGRQWSYLRAFTLASSKPVKIGFLAQSPLSPEFIATYSNIHFEEKTISDFWQGK